MSLRRTSATIPLPPECDLLATSEFVCSFSAKQPFPMHPKSIVPIFYVSDVDAAVAHYATVLGFAVSFRYGTYAGLTFGACELHVTDTGEARQIVGAGTAYVLCDEVDVYFAKIKAAGARLKNEPANRPYGMRDFAVFDLDGNQVSFGCDADQA
jgi:uncharacterized glyoxalase superfamily protein PhnB